MRRNWRRIYRVHRRIRSAQKALHHFPRCSRLCACRSGRSPRGRHELGLAPRAQHLEREGQALRVQADQDLLQFRSRRGVRLFGTRSLRAPALQPDAPDQQGSPEVRGRNASAGNSGREGIGVRSLRVINNGGI